MHSTKRLPAAAWWLDISSKHSPYLEVVCLVMKKIPDIYWNFVIFSRPGGPRAVLKKQNKQTKTRGLFKVI